MLFVVFGWVLFRAETLADAWIYLKSMFGIGGNALTDGFFAGYFKQNVILLVAGIVLSTPLFRILKKKTEKSVLIGIVTTVGLIGLFILSVASLVSSSYNPFIYFNF